jgi:serine/threonine-protein kinase
VPNSDLAGSILGEKFQMLEQEDRSSKYGQFWRAKKIADDSLVSVRLLKPELFRDPHATVRFERETRVLRKFRHPNLLQVVSHGRTDEGLAYLVTEYREGRSLGDEIGELPVETVCHIAMQIAAVLAAAHSQGIVHRGLEPDAILLCENGADPNHVKVLDFGLAHMTTDSGEAQVTLAGQRIGKAEYLAPEYIRDQQLDARSDVYVLGILTFEMLIGQPPFVGPMAKVLRKHLDDTPWTPSELCEEEVPEWLDTLVLACLAKSPADRPQTGLQVARAFAYRQFPM